VRRPQIESGAKSPLVLHDLDVGAEALHEAVWQGLSRRPFTLPCKFLYDEEGAQLFDRICTVPAYYPTRTETDILGRNIGEIADRIGPQARIVEFGSGSGIKTRILLEAVHEPAAYVPVDISRVQLIEVSMALDDDFPGLDVTPVCADYTEAFQLPDSGRETRRTVAFFPGSTIGNFEPVEAVRFLRRVARLVGPGGGLVIGADLVKDQHTLEVAYDDPDGVTAAFNLNLLRRINRECGADFDLEHFRHRAVFNHAEARIEMHLVSTAAQMVRLPASDVRPETKFTFGAGDFITTEHSHKYTRASFQNLAERAGFRVDTVWTDAREWFSVQYLTVPQGRGPVR